MKSHLLKYLILLFLLMPIMPQVASAQDQYHLGYVKPDFVEQEFSLLAYSNQRSYSYRISPAKDAKTADQTPTISFNLDANHFTVESIRLYLNQQFLSSDYKSSSQSIVHDLNEPLLPGIHNIRVEVKFRGYEKSTLHSSFTIIENPIDPFEEKDVVFLQEQQQVALKKLNKFRASLGLTLYTPNSLLSKGAQAHSNYFIFNNYNSAHDESVGSPGFTGVTPWERAEYYGYTGYVGEGISYDKQSAAIGVDDLMDAPYHRLSIIDPNYNEIGVGFNFNADEISSTVIKYGTTSLSLSDSQVVLYPYPGQQDAKAGWFVAENPNPLEHYNLDRIFTGYPISMSIHDENTQELQFISATILNEAGNELSYYQVDSANEDKMKKHIFLLPKNTLQLGETYRVQIEAKRIFKNGQSEAVNRSWSFTTKEDVTVMNMNIIQKNNREYVNVRLDNGDIEDVKIDIKKDGELYQTFNSEGKGFYRSYKPLEVGEFQVELESSFFDETQRFIANISGSKGNREITWQKVDSSKMKLDPAQYTLFPEKKNIPSDKQWVIKLNTKMDIASIRSNNIYVLDEFGTKQKVKVNLTSDLQHIMVSPPSNGYELGATYYLFINKEVQSLTKKTMQKPTVMKFTIKSE